MSQMRVLVHDMLNKLAIAQGMLGPVKDSLEGKRELAHEKQVEKITKVSLALEELEKLTAELRELLRKENP